MAHGIMWECISTDQLPSSFKSISYLNYSHSCINPATESRDSSIIDINWSINTGSSMNTPVPVNFYGLHASLMPTCAVDVYWNSWNVLIKFLSCCILRTRQDLVIQFPPMTELKIKFGLHYIVFCCVYMSSVYVYVYVCVYVCTCVCACVCVCVCVFYLTFFEIDESPKPSLTYHRCCQKSSILEGERERERGGGGGSLTDF